MNLHSLSVSELLEYERKGPEKKRGGGGGRGAGFKGKKGKRHLSLIM